MSRHLPRNQPANQPFSMMTSSTISVPNGLPILWRDDDQNKTTTTTTNGTSSSPSQEFLDAAWSHCFNHRRATATRIPRAVIHATQKSHIVDAVKLAKQLGVRVSVRSGGHSWAGWGVREDAILLDLGALPGGKFFDAKISGDGLEYDDRTKIIAVPPSATGRIVNSFLETKGRMFAGGHCSDVGLGGFLLQGGMGWNCKNWGWACESIVGIDVVTADGEEIYCSQSENADLFWAARGAGPGKFLPFYCVTLFRRHFRGAKYTNANLNLFIGFPAIVTRFYLLTRPLPQMYENVYMWRLSHYREALQWVLDVRLFSPLWQMSDEDGKKLTYHID